MIRIINAELKREIIIDKAMKYNVGIEMYAGGIQLKQRGSANHWVKTIDTKGLQDNKKVFGNVFWETIVFNW